MSSETNGTAGQELGTTAVAVRENAEMDMPVWNRQGDVVLAFSEHLETRWRIANMIAKSGMTHHRKPEAIMAIQLTAFEMGLPLMQAMRGMYYVQGKIGLEGHLMDALAIQRCGVSKTVREQSLERCAMTLHRDGWDDLEVEYAMEDAIRAGLVHEVEEDGTVRSSKSPWKQHPKEMLYWRCLSKGLKQIAPDYFGGVYHVDEMEEVAGVARASSEVSTNAELDALEKGVEPDEGEMTEDEIGEMRAELREAHEAGLIDGDRMHEALEAAIAGEWEDAREVWDEARGALARAEADGEEEQPDLLDGAA